MRITSLAYTSSQVCIQLLSTFTLIPTWVETFTTTTATTGTVAVGGGRISGVNNVVSMAIIKNMNVNTNNMINRVIKIDIIKIHNILLLIKMSSLLWQSVIYSLFESSPTTNLTATNTPTKNTTSDRSIAVNVMNTLPLPQILLVYEQVSTWLHQDDLDYPRDVLFLTNNLKLLTTMNLDIETTITSNTTNNSSTTMSLIPKMNQMIAVDDCEVNVIYILLQTSYYLYSLNTIVLFHIQTITSEHTTEYINNLTNLKTEVQLIQQILVCSNRNVHYSSARSSLIQIRNVLYTSMNLITRTIELSSPSTTATNNSSVSDNTGNNATSNVVILDNTTSNSIFRQTLASIHEATIICKDMFSVDSLTNNTNTNNTNKALYGENRIGDILLMTRSIMKLFDNSSSTNNVNNNTDNNIITTDSDLHDSLKISLFNTTNPTNPTNTNNNTTLIPTWKIRCQAIRAEILNWETMKSQLSLLSTQKSSLETELRQRKDELKAAISRCEELSKATTNNNNSTSLSSKSISGSGGSLSRSNHNNNTNSNNNEEEELKLLQQALNSLEKRYEVLERENKLLKTTSKSNNNNISSLTSSRSNQNIQNFMDLDSPTGVSVSNNSGVGTGISGVGSVMNTSRSTRPNTSRNSLLVDTNLTTGNNTSNNNNNQLAIFDNEIMESLKKQINNYRVLATKRLTESLEPLPAITNMPWLEYSSDSNNSGSTDSNNNSGSTDIATSGSIFKTKEEKLALARRIYRDTRSIRASISVCDVTERKQVEHLLPKGYSAELIEEYLRELSVVASSSITSY